MIALILAAGLVVAVPGALSRHVARRLPPRAWAILALASVVSAGLYVTVGLALLSAPVVLPVLAGSSVAETCRVLLERFEPGGVATAWAATVLLGSAVGAATVRRWRSRRRRATLRVPSYLGVHEQQGGFELVTLPTPTPLAYSLGGPHPQAVISAGLRSRLDGSQIAAVVAHEAAHLRWHHQRWLDAVDLATGLLWFVPWARRSAHSARVALECWADEEAATVTGRDALRSALLLAADVAPTAAHVAALNGADAIAERVTMLDQPSGGSGGIGPATAGLFVLGAVAAATGAVGGAPQLATLFSHLCPL
ncbi:MAG: M48 family metalloprotease [Actinomycetota bacterium]|nr:M48 family metalloprotease [Actinomycetota bacterium]